MSRIKYPFESVVIRLHPSINCLNYKIERYKYNIFKKVEFLNHLKKRINKSLRFSRKVYFVIFDLLGDAIFFLLRFLNLIPKIREFKRDDIKKILIIRLDRIGDLILSTPAIRAVRENFPKAKIYLLVRDYIKDLVINNHNIDKLIIYEKDKIDNDFDLSIALHPGIRQNYITFISGARYRIGYRGKGGSFFLTHKLKDDREIRIRHEVESNLEVVGIISCLTKDKTLEISVTEDGESFAEELFQVNQLKKDDLVIIIHPGARRSCMQWKKEGFAQVADELFERYKAKVIFIGDDKEKDLIETITLMMKNRPISACDLPLRNLISLIKKSDLFIGNSTGPMHIASALNVPVIAIFGNIHPLDSYQEWGPWGEGHIVVSKNLNCPDCHPGDCRTFDCINLITTEDVLETVERKIKEIWVRS